MKGNEMKGKEMKGIISTLNTLKIQSSVPNRRVGRNKRAGGKILRKH